MAKEYHKNLENKNLLFIYEENNKIINYRETMFLSYHFLHLTGLKIVNSQRLNSKTFYSKLLSGKINIQEFEFKNNLTQWKLEILPQIIQIEQLANQVGEFCNSGILLKTDVLVGTTRNAILGLKFIFKNKIYVPNTILKEDIKKLVSKRNRIIAVMKKNLKEEKYSEFTYINKKTSKEILRNNTELKFKIK